VGTAGLSLRQAQGFLGDTGVRIANQFQPRAPDQGVSEQVAQQLAVGGDFLNPMRVVKHKAQINEAGQQGLCAHVGGT
jgi:hypothetical protein